MNPPFAIKAENLGKQFIRKSFSSRQALRNNLEEIIKKPFVKTANFLGVGQPTLDNYRRRTNKFWALKEVSFTIQPGEIVGIIGHNGAGKSVLLKILSQITKPTTGYVDMYGKCSSMLEVDTGFHQELTGAENIFMSGAILGMKKNYIKKKFSEIVAISEIEDFLEMPVKRYSSGMRVRLSFAIAAQLKPDILILDEILAVGDQQFKEKSRQFLKELSLQGTTILLVSHQEKNITDLCSRALLLEQGRLIMDDKAALVMKQYAKEHENNNL